jgi:hypothetical protein
VDELHKPAEIDLLVVVKRETATLRTIAIKRRAKVTSPRRLEKVTNVVALGAFLDIRVRYTDDSSPIREAWPRERSKSPDPIANRCDSCCQLPETGRTTWMRHS